MIKETIESEVSVVSVHDEGSAIQIELPNVNPSRYLIPGISASPEIFKNCRFTFPDQKPFQYAYRRTIEHHPYVLLKIVEAKSPIFGTEEQKIDEYGKKLLPDVMRVPVPVHADLIANELERQCGIMGVMAVKGEVTLEIVRALEKKNIEFLQKTVAATNRLSKVSPLNVTNEAKLRAWKLHEKGLLNPLPEWASINPSGLSTEASGTFNCVNCSKVLRKGVIRCECGAVYDWKEAVSRGMIKPGDVPPSRMVEAGLAIEGPSGSPEISRVALPPDAPSPEDGADETEAAVPEIDPEEIGGLG